MSNTGSAKPGTPEGIIQYSNGDYGLVSELCRLPPKRLEMIGSELIKDWGKYCYFPGPTVEIPDPTPGCEQELVFIDSSWKYRVEDDIGTSIPPRTALNSVGSWGPVGSDYVYFGANPEGGPSGIVTALNIGDCPGQVRYSTAMYVGQEVTGVGIVAEILPDITVQISLSGQKRNCCAPVLQQQNTEYVRPDTYTRSEFFQNVVPELILAFLPIPPFARVGKNARSASKIRGLVSVARIVPPRLGRPLSTAGLGRKGLRLVKMSPVDDGIRELVGRPLVRTRGFAPARVAPTRPRPGKPLPTRDLPSRKPKPAPKPAPKPERAPRPSQPKRPRTPDRPSRPPARPPSVPKPSKPPTPVPKTPQRGPNLPRPQPPRIPAPRPPNVPATPPVPTRPPSPAFPRSPRPSRPRVPVPARPISPTPEPRPVPSPSPSPVPSPVPSPSPIPTPNRPGQPIPRPSPFPNRPPDRGLPSPVSPPTSPPWRIPSKPAIPRPSPFPTRPRVPTPQIVPVSPAPWRVPFRPDPDPLPVLAPPRLSLTEFPEVPINQNPCAPCPVNVVIREVPVVIQGPPGPPGKDGEDGENGENGSTMVMISTKVNVGIFAQVLDFTQSVKGKTSGTLPPNISRVVVRYGEVSSSLPSYGITETGEKLGGYGTIAVVINDVIISQYSLNRFSDTQVLVPHGLGQTVELFVSPLVACRVAILDEGDRWEFYRVSDPENLPEVSSTQLNP